MRNTILLGLVILFASACGHKSAKTETAPPAAASAATTTPTATTTDTKHKTKSKVKAAAKAVKNDATDAAATVTGDTATCTHGEDSRTLEIKAKDAGCELVYTKAGGANSVATSASGKKHCADVSAKIQGKLIASGFACK